MAHVRRAARWLLACLCLACAHAAAGAQDLGATAKTAQVRISYEPPQDAKYNPVHDALKRRQVLERLQLFLTPLRLPRELLVRLAQCGAETVPYQAGGPVTICYELVQHVADIAAQHTKDADEQAQIMDGTFVEAVLHQTAYAVFDLLQVPIWGRKDDAADRLAALIMMQFGEPVALTTIVGTAKFFEYSNHTWTGEDFADESSPEAQRFYNYLCIAWGGDPVTFHFAAPRPGPSAFPRLDEYRASFCAREYAQIRDAFNLRIMPFIDPDLLVKVRATPWLLPDEIPEGLK
jgi:hypothetical protein